MLHASPNFPLSNLQRNHQIALIVFGHLIFGILLVWAAIYAEARTLSYDTSWRTLELIQQRKPKISHHRYLLIAIQWLPLLVLKLGGSLKAILWAHSISWVLFSYGVYIVLVHVMKDLEASFLLILSLVLTTGTTFFYMAAELPHSLTVFALFVGCVRWEKGLKGNKRLLWLALCCLLIMISSYGQRLIGAVFVWFLLFEIIRNRLWKNPVWMGLLGFVILWFAFRFLAISAHSYASARIIDVFDVEVGDMFSVDSIYLGGWLMKVKKGLWLGYVATFGVIASYFTQKRFLLLAYLILSLIVYTVAGIVISSQGVLASYHYMMIWGGMIGWPLILTISAFKKQTFTVAILVLIILIGTHTLHQHRQHFVKHIAYIAQLLKTCNEQGTPKTLVHTKQLDANYLWTPEYLGVESLMISSLEGPAASSTIFLFQNGDKFQLAKSDPNLWLGPIFAPFTYSAEALHPRYFQLPETVYQELISH